MSDTPLNNLRKYIISEAGKGEFALDAAFLTEGLNDDSVTVPKDYDDNITKAYQVENAQAFIIKVDAGDVGAIDNNSFTVKNANIPLLGAAVKTNSTIVFGLTGDEGSQTLVVQIQSSPNDWTWNISFPFMTGFPFNQLDKLITAEFIFSTSSGTYPFTDSSGKKVENGAKQNFYTTLNFPEIAQQFIALFDGLKAPTTIDLNGALDLSTYDGENVLYPGGSLNASINEGSFEVFYLTVANPRIQLYMPPGVPPSDEDEDDEDSGQAATFSVTSDLEIKENSENEFGELESDPVNYEFKVSITEPVGETNTSFTLGLFPNPDSGLLTPTTVIDLIGGGGSYFGSTPPELQGFLANVGLQGLGLEGELSPSVKLTSVAVEIGTPPGENIKWSPIPEPINILDFEIQSFNLQWSLQNPTAKEIGQQNFNFSTQFTLAPDIFKTMDGDPGGIFKVEFNSSLQFFASFDGKASLSDFLSGLTAGALSLPSSISAELSNISLSLDYNTKSFTFSSGFDIELNFLEIAGNPILAINGGQVSIAAKTPTANGDSNGNGNGGSEIVKLLEGQTVAGKNTVWKGEVSGLMTVGPFKANAKVAYDGFSENKMWNLEAALAEELNVGDLIEQFFDPTGSYDFPDFLKPDLTILTFEIKAEIPTNGETKEETANSTSYSIDTSFKWDFDFGGQIVKIDPAKISLAYDGSKPETDRFSGSAEGNWVYENINLQLLMGYKFATEKGVTNHILFVVWEGFTAQYESGKDLVTFSLKGWSIGSLIQAMVRTIGNPYFVLPSPWDLLNKVSLDGLSINVDLSKDAKSRFSASYTLSNSINLGFVNIKGLEFKRVSNSDEGNASSGQVTLALALETPLPPAISDDPKLKNLTTPGEGQDVNDMPSIPGQGQEYFKLFLLALGQKIGIRGASSFKNTKAVICALADVPNTTGKENPVDPTNSKPGQPYYNQANNWLIAGHLGLLKIGKSWTVDVMAVFNDPDLYGLRLALAGEKAGGLAGLSIDILYKKITDDIGVYQIEFTFPDSIRNLNFGAVSIVLPQIGVKVYTNGDFFIDIGFPYNMDFKRSFSISAIIYGIPVLGAGGFYFGKLSNATSNKIPQTNQGTFNPVIEFGFGLQLGLGYNFTKGPLSAGFALTFFGIIEGVIASWHPYDQSTQVVELANPENGLQAGYYFKISGTVGIIGLLYGKIDFAIIQASLNVKIVLSLTITYESYRAIPLVASAQVEVSLKVKINLGIFSFSISLSFSAHVTAKFVIGEDKTAPWDDNAAIEGNAARSLRHTIGPDLIRKRSRQLIKPRPKKIVFAVDQTKPEVKVLAVSQFTVLAPENTSNFKDQQGAFVFMFAMDAPTATGEPNPDSDTSFDKLSEVFFPWVIDALKNSSGDFVDLADVAGETVNKADLELYIDALADNDNPPLSIADYLGFMSSALTFDIISPAEGEQNGMKEAVEKGSTLFPVFDGLSLSIPNPDGGNAKDINFETYTTATEAYRTTVSEILSQVQARIEADNQTNNQKVSLADAAESMAGLVFSDTFNMLGRQYLQAAFDSMSDYSYALVEGQSVEDIINWANAQGSALDTDDVVLPNQEHALTAGIKLSISGLNNTIQTGDTLASIAKQYSDSEDTPRWTTSPENLIISNQMQRIIQPNVVLELQGKDGQVTYVTKTGDTFLEIAKEELDITIEALAAQEVLYTTAGLLTPTQQIFIPDISYTTAPGAASGDPSSDNLSSVAKLFATTVSMIGTTNKGVANLFAINDHDGIIALANLTSLSIANLWAAIMKTDQVAQTAGMVSRFLMYGLRLPKADGLEFSSEFLYPQDQSAFGFYQLTGQQFPTPSTAPASYAISVSRADTSHGVNLDFIQFNGTTNKDTSIDLTKALENLDIVLTWAQGGNFLPSPSLQILPLSDRVAKQFAITNFANWSTADVANLINLTNRTADTLTDTGSGATAQPILWPLPDSTLSLVENRQSALDKIFGDVKLYQGLLPQMQPRVGSTSTTTNATAFRNIENWAWTTRVDFEVKRLPQATDGPFDTFGDDYEPSGLATAPPLKNVYEIVGPSSEDALLLDRILTVMDSLGEDIVSDIFLLYAQSTASSVELITPGNNEILSFITQTNLSTETNPVRSFNLAKARTDNTPPRGIANSPGEFIKLLWELSVVRSGGYFLYYEEPESGNGLPSTIFDTSGSATISLVVTYAATGEFSFGNSLFNFVNSFVTTDSIDTGQDTVAVESLSASDKSKALTGDATETLESVSIQYGLGVGRIAEVNPDFALVEDKIIPMTGLRHQISQKDLDAQGDTLTNLANYYSVGAVEAINATQIQDLNPGVTVALGSVYFIPNIEYKVMSAAPGNTFSKIADYYGITLDAVAINAREVGGLLPANSQLVINTELFDLRSTLGPGNIGVELERVNKGEPSLPADPTPAQEAEFAEQYMYMIYNTLSAGLAENVYFNQSAQGLPFGPQGEGQSTANDDIEVYASHAQRLKQRRERLLLSLEDDYTYKQSLGFGSGLAKINASPDPADPALPPKADNPYIGVGTVAQIDLRWQDIFGNITITPFTKVPDNYKGAINGSAGYIGYSDRLIGVGSWPNVQFSHIYSGTSDAALLNLNFVLDTSKYSAIAADTEEPTQLTRDLELFKQIYFQLNQDYTGLGVPEVTGNAVSMFVSNSLLDEPITNLNETQAGVIRQFISDCVIALDKLANGMTLDDEPTANLQLPVDVANLNAENIIELDVELTFQRQDVLVSPDVAGLEGGLSVNSIILPQPDGGQTIAYTHYATEFESVFNTDDWFMKVGEGLKQTQENDSQENQQLWAVRFGNSKGQGIYFEIENSPNYYAPKPIAKSLQSGQANIVDYASGKSNLTNFTGVDMNLWFQTCLDAVDDFLSAQESTSAFILDKTLGTDDPLKDGYLGKILSAKELLANTISSTTTPILSTSESDKAYLFSAAEKMRQQLLNRLGAAYAAGAVTVFGLTDASGVPLSEAGPPNLYGQPVANTAQESLNQNYTLTPSRIPLGKVTDPISMEQYDPQVSFVFQTKNVLLQSYVPLNDLTLEISYLEFDLNFIPGIKGYVQSRWLGFVNGPFSYKLTDPSGPDNGTANVPVINRNLPTPPTMQKQSGDAHYTNPETANELTRWDYGFEYLYDQAVQDTVQLEVTLNLGLDGSQDTAMVTGPSLFETLAQFISDYPSIEQAFNEYLIKIDGTAESAAFIPDAEKAVKTFQENLTAVAEAYARSLNQPVTAFVAAPEIVKIDFSLLLSEGEGGIARTDIFGIKINDVLATFNEETNEISAGGITLPAMVVQIDPENYCAVYTAPPDSNIQISYIYQQREDSTSKQLICQKSTNPDTKYLSAADAVNIPLRTVIIPTLDIMAYQSGYASLFVTRNLILFPVQDIGKITTNKSFQFTTPTVKFANPLQPRLNFNSFQIGKGVEDPNLDNVLNDFFNGLFENGDGSTTVEVQMTSSYSYEMVPGNSDLPRVILPISMLPPVSSPVEQDVSNTFVAPLAQTVEDWVKANNPTTTGKPQENFILKVFGSSGGNQPILDVSDLFLELESDDD